MPSSPSHAAGPRLRPREHGAYAMLAFPAVSGLALGGVSLAGVAFVALSVSGFLAHEAALVMLGRRGERVRTAADRAARVRLGVLGGVGTVAAATFVAAAPEGALAWALLPAGLGVIVGGLLLAGGTKSVPGELVVAAAFAAIHGPVAAAAGVAGWGAATPVTVWASSFALATLAVHALKVRFRGRGSATGTGRWLIPAAPLAAGAVLALAVASAMAGWGGLSAVTLALTPKALLVLALAALDVHPRHLKRVGWSLVGADVATLLVMALG